MSWKKTVTPPPPPGYGPEQLLAADRKHLWHPYSAIGADLPLFPVRSARGTRITLADGRELVDGMASWWCAIHGYNHPVLNRAVVEQLDDMAHIMFGGLTHRPAVALAERLVALTPAPLQSVFFADSGSVSVEVAMKMAIQYQVATGAAHKTRFLTLRGGYHGDTLHAMSVCDPVTGMHTLFGDVVRRQYFVDRPPCRFGTPCSGRDLEPMAEILAGHGDIAAVILEPIVQGAGGMYFYSADYLAQVRELCGRHGVLLIADEIATGFGRTGKLFACEHAGIAPDILCLGKSLTGGYMTLAATLTTPEVSRIIARGEPGLFMHGPTFMANPLACATALASLELLLASPWQDRVRNIEAGLAAGLEPCRGLPPVADVRALGAIGVVELAEPVDMKRIQPRFVEQGVWVRPFGRLVYLMPAFIIDDADLETLTRAVVTVVSSLNNKD
uniref:Adenosylmethionine-8-amino-7-oxononanoate aminotransferase n=1 Tax=Candidatus Kentrum sp. FM TaxID=2126340 RepID=A0A450S5Y7_9GAMM|nr:MAG: adenosylmethionine-8-amino-7-oxononanoate aminotransferase [Candidatus Kentron sp. FM]VFJ47273.1 MAG: adenosylmethionine-8-amino-7-oxononanoate aminotransferase [Candidatus Kentron sp. FM]VFK07155.1 MAG: adenosylmethionine-8-amino-7-oxononanoate aminotransferase [Candidatus Kentron sp. FM]